MKRILYLLFIAGGPVFAQTNITGPSVSGTWTLTGSPYIIQNIITVSGGQVLTIEPGVVVKFQPAAKITVSGQLIASGTSISPIIFEAIDTVGWSNQTISNGGWNGIHFHQYSGGGADLSRLDYCTIKDAKYGYTFAVMYCNALTSERGLKLNHCTFQHNHTGTSGSIADPPLNLRTYLATDTIIVDHCTFTDNTSVFGVIQNNNFGNGATMITNCHIHHNHLGSGIYSNWNNLLIENCEINNNDMINDHGPIRVSLGTATIRGNKIHHNQSDDYGGIACRAGRITIENNLICNNRQDDAFCGISGGGAGINVAHNDNGAFEDTYYIIRNNIVANNYAAYGGGGMYVWNARATISNNHIINNYTPNQGHGIMILHPNSEVYMINNLFHNQSGIGNVDSTQVVYILTASKIQFDNNYIPSPFFKSVQASTGYTLIGDTMDNVIGTSPGMVAPTIDNNYMTSALTANFQLMSSSPCIDEGDTAGAFSAVADYAGNFRIENIIDIGAYEYGSKAVPLGIENSLGNGVLKMNIYPNPISANSHFMVVTPETEGKLVISDIYGKIVYEQAVNSEKNLVNLNEARGIYLVYFYGKKNSFGKIMIK